MIAPNIIREPPMMAAHTTSLSLPNEEEAEILKNFTAPTFEYDQMANSKPRLCIQRWMGAGILLLIVATGLVATLSSSKSSNKSYVKMYGMEVSVEEVFGPDMLHELGLRSDWNKDGLRMLRDMQSSSNTKVGPAISSGLQGTLYYIAYLSGKEVFGCEKPMPAMTARCNGNGMIQIIEQPQPQDDVDPSCYKVDDQTIQCEPQEKGLVLVRCDALVGSENLGDLVLEVTLPEADLTCDACMDESCNVYRSDMKAESYNRLFVLTGCNEAFYALPNDVCSTGNIKTDVRGHRYCESSTGCQIPSFGETCGIHLDATTVSASAPLLPDGFQCIYPLGWSEDPIRGSHVDLDPASASPSFFESFSSTSPSQNTSESVGPTPSPSST